jgi:hypothetical protein
MWIFDRAVEEGRGNHSVFAKNSERVPFREVAVLFFWAVYDQSREEGWASDDHFSADGTLIEEWASMKTFVRKHGADAAKVDAGKDDNPGNPTIIFKGEIRRNETHRRRRTSPAQRSAAGLGGSRRTHPAHRPRLRRWRSPASTLQKLVHEHTADALILHEPLSPWMRAARGLPMPTHFLGGDIPPKSFAEVSGFAVSIHTMTVRLVQRLHRLGHRRIVMPDEGRGPDYRRGVLLGLHDGADGRRSVLSDELACPIFAELEPEARQRYWEDCLRCACPTACIVLKESSYLSLLGCCSRHGRRIP